MEGRETNESPCSLVPPLVSQCERSGPARSGFLLYLTCHGHVTEAMLFSHVLTCCSGLKKPSFSHHSYQHGSTYSGLYVDGNGKLVSTGTKRLYCISGHNRWDSWGDRKSLTFLCPCRCMSRVHHFLLLAPFQYCIFRCLQKKKKM